MPRGLRAVHGSEVTHGLHAHPPATTKFITADPDALLEVSCWCEQTDVLVPQHELRRGNRTRSCGDPECGPGPVGRVAPGRHKPGSGKTGGTGQTGRTGTQSIYRWADADNGLWKPPTPMTNEELMVWRTFGTAGLIRHRTERAGAA